MRQILLTFWFVLSAPCAWSQNSPDECAQRLQAAVEAQDAGAYLALVNPNDAELLAETRAWCADWQRHPVASYRLEFDRDTFKVQGDVAEVGVRQVWSLEGHAGIEQWVEFTARFVRVAEGNDESAWRYAGRAWRELRGEAVRVRHEPGFEESARAVAEAWPKVVDAVKSDVWVDLTAAPGGGPRVQVVSLYPSMRALQASIGLGYERPLSGWNEPGESIKLLISRTDRFVDDCAALLAHEAGHVALFLLSDERDSVPWWVHEGTSEYIADRFAGAGDANHDAVRTRARERRLVKWSRLHRYEQTSDRWAWAAYRQGHDMVRFITREHGLVALNAWLRALGEGRTLEDASAEHLGIGFKELDARWRSGLARPAMPRDGA